MSNNIRVLKRKFIKNLLKGHGNVGCSVEKKEVYKLICGEAEAQTPLALCPHEGEKISGKNRDKN